VIFTTDAFGCLFVHSYALCTHFNDVLQSKTSQITLRREIDSLCGNRVADCYSRAKRLPRTRWVTLRDRWSSHHCNR
jgi:hypothetical protein